MSGLEKFEANDAWRKNFKKLLFTERNPTPKLVDPLKEARRFSLDIVEDLQILLNENKAGRSERNTKNEDLEQKKVIFHTDESKKTITRMSDSKSVLESNSALFAESQSTSDESFEAIENMCNKTASDPDSTLFQYMHTEHKEQVVEKAKKRLTGKSDSIGKIEQGYDAEDDALQRLLGELNMEDQVNQQLKSSILVHAGDVTQLDDIEAPSKLWEQTFTGDTVLQTSPVKMVGLFRPSTILEEWVEDGGCSDVSSQISFQTAFKSAPSDASSSCYDTAYDTTATSSTTNAGCILIEVGTTVETNGNMNWHDNIKDGNASVVEQTKGCGNVIDLNEYINLIDLEKTFAPIDSPYLEVYASEVAQKLVPLEEEIATESEESIIEIFSDDESPHKLTEKSDEIGIKFEMSSSAAYNSILATVNCFAFEDEKENIDIEETRDKSLNFNDTMEEVDYIIKKGMENLVGAKYTHDYNAVVAPSSGSLLSPMKRHCSPLQISKTQAPIPTKSGIKGDFAIPKTPASPLNKPKLGNRFALNMKPMPKLDIFRMRHKEVSNRNFSHIVSPIGAYMKKTATTPLMTSIKTKNTNTDVLNSTAFRELEYDSRLYPSSFQDENDVGSTKLPIISGVPLRLPKKAYISSKFKHIVDERTPVTIPGGKKIQKYLETAMLPAVVRHEGKLNMSGMAKACNSGNLKLHTSVAGSSSQTQRRGDGSLTDLSLMSGDVSVYTIVDAQKF